MEHTMEELNLASDPATPSMRRAVTLPIRAHSRDQRRSLSSASSPDPTVETLYGHSSARIVSFNATAPTSTRRNSSADAASAEEETGSLSWTSSLERTIAVGPLRIYRAPNSVTFLNCGRVIQPIFPKSKCWCVEEGCGKFVLQMRKPQYWRIEIPSSNAEDLQKIEDLKAVLPQVLLYEKTACPFQRTFTVALPEAPTTPIKYKPWKPKVEFVARSRGSPPEIESGEDYFTAASDDNDMEGLGSDSDCTDDTNVTPRNTFSRSTHPPHVEESIEAKPDLLLGIRCVTAPPQLTLVTSPPSKTRTTSPLRKCSTVESISSDHSSSEDSFHSIQSWHSPITPLPPSPPLSNPTSPSMFPFPHDQITIPKRPHHSREISLLTAPSESPRIWGVSTDVEPEIPFQALRSQSYSPPPKTPTTPTLIDDLEDNLDEEHFEIATPPTVIGNRIRHRGTTSSNTRRRALSPLPSAANIFSPSRRRPRHLQTARHLPTAILQKTCEILLSPPSHLVSLMLDIASKITAGGWKDWVWGPEDIGDLMGTSSWEEEDDFGIAINGNRGDGTVRKRNQSRNFGIGESWEID